MADEVNINARLDITGEVCPMTFVKTKLELEDLEPGDVLEVLIREGESLENVTRSCVDEGHELLARDPGEPPVWRLLIRKGAE